MEPNKGVGEFTPNDQNGVGLANGVIDLFGPGLVGKTVHRLGKGIKFIDNNIDKTLKLAQKQSHFEYYANKEQRINNVLSDIEAKQQRLFSEYNDADEICRNGSAVYYKKGYNTPTGYLKRSNSFYASRRNFYQHPFIDAGKIELNEPYILEKGSSESPFSVSFTDQLGNSTTANGTYSSMKNKYVPSGINCIYIKNGQHGTPIFKMSGIESGHSGIIYHGDFKDYANAYKRYMDAVNRQMGDDGVVAGSVVHYANRSFPATFENGTLKGAQDTEIYTTSGRLQNL